MCKCADVGMAVNDFLYLGNGIVALAAPGMAARNAFCCQPGAFEYAVFL